MSAVAGPPVVARGGFAAWLELTKPRIISLVLFTGVPALLLAAQGWPAPGLFWGTVVGITLSAASAASFNHYFDRDIDALMVRTRTRPLPSGALPPRAAVILGFVLAGLATIVLVATSNVLAAVIALVSIFYYAVFYTVWLKRRTPLNIVIGGGAGASAPLIAWAAVTGRVELPAILLASIIFLWTPPHFWALALYRVEDYRQSGLPMLPVTHGNDFTRLHIFLYTLLLAAACLMPFAFGMSSWIYLVCAVVLSIGFIAYAVALLRQYSDALARKTFRFSLIHLTALFAAFLLDHYAL